MNEILAYALRIGLLFTLIYWVLRISGKKTISVMTAVDLMGVVIIAAMAAEPLVSSSAIKTVFGIGTVVALQLAFSFLGLENRLGPILQQQPTLLIRQGQIDRAALRQSQISLEQLLSELRLKECNSIADVEYALLEPSGKVSVIPTAQARPVKPRDLHLPMPYEGLSLPLVMDGTVIHPNLRYAGVNERWLQDRLQEQGYRDPAGVFLAELDVQGVLTVQAQPGRGGPFFGTGPGGAWRPPAELSPSSPTAVSESDPDRSAPR